MMVLTVAVSFITCDVTDPILFSGFSNQDSSFRSIAAQGIGVLKLVVSEVFFLLWS